MTTIKNPIISGMAPDPSVIRVGEDYYVATSTFHWTPGIPIYHSKNLANWELITHALSKDEVNLQGTDTPAGIWAPNLTYDNQTKKFWLTYCHMVNMGGREFNANSYTMWSDNICGPWSEPIYLTSIGIDPSIFHDTDGKQYLSILEWESRQGYPSPGTIVVAEVDLETGKILSDWHRITQGFTTRGCVEAPHIYKNDSYYYMILASGGTGYAHGVEVGRSKNIFGPYESHPSNEPIITSSPAHLFSLGDPDAGHFEMYNPLSNIQKSGHGSLVQTDSGEWYIFHLMSRPLTNKLLNPLGRETAIQKVEWNKDGWLQMSDGSNLAKEYVEIPYQITNQVTESTDDINEEFSKQELSKRFMTPYHFQNNKWVSLTENPGYLRIYGKDSLFSRVTPSIMATTATSFLYEVRTKLNFKPTHYSEKAGLGLYYDSNNWLFVNVHYSELTNDIRLGLSQAKLGERIDFIHETISIFEESIALKIKYNYGNADIFYRMNDSDDWKLFKEKIDVSYLSDEGVNGVPGEIGGFTGLFNFIGCVDSYQHQSYCDFSYYCVNNMLLEEN